MRERVWYGIIKKDTPTEMLKLSLQNVGFSAACFLAKLFNCQTCYWTLWALSHCATTRNKLTISNRRQCLRLLLNISLRYGCGIWSEFDMNTDVKLLQPSYNRGLRLSNTTIFKCKPIWTHIYILCWRF